MLPILIAKELKHNLLSFRFVASLVFVLMVYGGSSLVFCKRFQNELEENQHSQELFQRALASGTQGLRALYAETIPLTKAPRPSSFFASGNENRYPKTIYMTPSAARRGGLFAGMNLTNQRVNYKLENYTNFDLVFIIGVVLSFLAIVLSFDAITRDREEGMLKLQLSSAVPRAQVLLAKYLAILILLFVPIILGSIISLVIIQLLLGQIIPFAFPLQALLNGALGVIYLSLFVWMGLWISASVSRSSTSLAFLLLLWTFAVVLAPYLGGMMTQRYHPVASKDEYDEKFQAVMRDFIQGAPKEMRDVMSGKEGPESWKVIADYFERCDHTMEQFVLNRFTELMNQAKAAEAINVFSPYSAFRQGAEQLSNIGLTYHQKFFEAAVRYRHAMKSFIYEQDLSDPQSQHHLLPFPGMLAISNKPVESRLVPRFSPPPQNLRADVAQTLPFAGYLVILNVVFFLLAHFTFAHSDVR